MLILCGFTKNPVYRGGSHEKLIYRRKLPKKGGLGQCRFRRGGLGKKGGRVFEGGWRGDTPIHTMNLAVTLSVILIY